MKCPECGKEDEDPYRCYKNFGSCYIAEGGIPEERYLCEGRYKIITPLREGGMSTIYLSEDFKEKTICIVKELRDYFSNDSEKDDAIYMFEVESYMLVTLKHPGIPLINNYFPEKGNYYLVMEYIDGINLEELFTDSRGRGLPEREVISWGIQICYILEYLHSHNPPIIHRDIKPDNFIKRISDGRLMIIDFGIATLYDPDYFYPLVGTPGYISYEQYEGKLHMRSDIYSLGVTLHQLLTGKDPTEGIPFEFEPLCEINPVLSPGLEKVIEKALERDMDKRYSSAEEFRKALFSVKSER